MIREASKGLFEEIEEDSTRREALPSHPQVLQKEDPLVEATLGPAPGGSKPSGEGAGTSCSQPPATGASSSGGGSASSREPVSLMKMPMLASKFPLQSAPKTEIEVIHAERRMPMPSSKSQMRPNDESDNERPRPREVHVKMPIGVSKGLTRLTSWLSSWVKPSNTREPQSTVAPLLDLRLAEGLPKESLFSVPAADPEEVPEEFRWCLPVLRTEAALRLGQEYIDLAQTFFDQGRVPPQAHDEEVELEALRTHGKSEADVPAYRHAARSLPLQVRKEIFFLRANDALFRPLVGEELQSKPVQGRIFSCGAELQSESIEDWLGPVPRALLIASTST